MKCLGEYDEWKAYYAAHEVCPSCFSASIEQTCIGVGVPYDANTGYDFSKMVDHNRAHCCKCDWSGIVHQLVPFPKDC